MQYIIRRQAADHTITIPDDLYARVADLAAEHGQTPDELIRAVTEAFVQASTQVPAEIDIPGYDPALDPLARFAGKYEATASDVTLRHDAYLAEEYANAQQS